MLHNLSKTNVQFLNQSMERMVKIMGFKFKFLYKLGVVFLICKEKKRMLDLKNLI